MYILHVRNFKKKDTAVSSDVNLKTPARTSDRLALSTPWLPGWLRRPFRGVASYLKGAAVCLLMALAATFVSEHYGGPQLLYALLIGLAFHFLVESPQVKPGVDFCARTLLRLGVALLGARITITQVTQLGAESAGLIVCAVVFTILLGTGLARLLRRPADQGLLSGAAVGICGASAALAVASVLPATKENERFTLMTVVGVTLLSTVAMVLYPFGLRLLDLTPEQSGIFLGGTIHDVAQVVAAGMLLGQDTGDTATVVKLFRVMLLMPAVLCISLVVRSRQAQLVVSGKQKNKVALVPGFLVAFAVLVALTSAGAINQATTDAASAASRWLLVIAIAAAGVKTSFQDLAKLGWQPVLMLVVETIFIAVFVLGGILGFSLGLR